MYRIPYDTVIELRYNLKEILLVFVLVLVIIRFLEYIWDNRYLYIKSWNVPGPTALPIIGSGYLFLLNHNQNMKVMEVLQEKFKGIFKIWFGPRLVYVVTQPEFIEKVLTSPYAIEKHAFYAPLRDIFGTGLVTGPGKIWKVHRKAIAPSFNKNILDSYVTIFAETSLKYVEFIKELDGKKNIDWTIITKRYSLEVAYKTITGVDLNVLHTEPRKEDLGDCIEKLNELATARIRYIWNHVNFLYQISSTKMEFDKYNKIFDKITTTSVKQQIKEFNEKKDDVYIETPGKTKNLLELLLLQDKIFTYQPLLDEAKTFIAAATDTTAMALCGIFIMLGMHQDVQQKVYEEVMDAIQFKREVEVPDLLKLKYTEMVIKESLRLFTPVVTIGRTMSADLQLGEITVPKGAICMLIPPLTHRSPEYWKDPLTFNPDRFLPEEVSKRHICSYFPFSYGPRNCIGGYYAYQNIKTVLATVMRDFKIFTTYKSVEEVKYELQPVLSFTKGMNVWFESRK